ncbi:phosphoenolpyruvate carboxykinase (ATP) [Alicyclobacillus cycloheptanicus]|uniref:Phosphoenolpyruvate carboxykinase (ATP) n=1 Tax=Alicyclobacillus cycloheptanicus TaxID=1457 RepID=A0ABT9XED4_9BACL|nr:phosphoenolpyruvate carboxykinase (ATP) [Alicyclobacillus cycloheptanicus]MDQ0188665.1 phosphoenolpyruvate carboxykinase (ATP) [Alicyclobacillus cycloheptanicus]WDM00662.1 phosphoenolpyruvate carboxykinase (ATP) [Alicyclobacillus cycloheptanicus]
MIQGTWKRLNSTELVEEAIRRGEGALLANGAFCAHTGKFTGRSPKDKFFVAYAGCPLPTERHQWITEAQFDRLFAKVQAHLQATGGYVFDGAVNQHPTHRVPVRFYTEFAWHNHFVQDLFLPGNPDVAPQYTVYGAPTLKAVPEEDGTRSETFIVIHLKRGIVLIGGTEYAGELKKSIFTLMHHHLAERGIMPMHCSASVGEAGDVALFFGLSGTGKTTLSADPARRLIGDDEHGWAEDGVFNMENGCYAKCIDLSREKEPDIYDAIRFGAVLENVVYDDARLPVYGDRSLTENTRAAYPLSFIRNIEPSGRGGHPQVIIFLSADASGVLPAVARLTPEDARKHYLLGYTSKLAGTERGVVSPEATFSACFGAPFLTDRPVRYADMLMERVALYDVPVYLLNTGWVGGVYGQVDRIPLKVTRDLVNRIIRGELNDVPTVRDDELFLNVPTEIPGVPDAYLHPQREPAHSADYGNRRVALAKSFADVLGDYLGVAER